jgi:SAM-dependent methyltransferase
MTDTRFRAAPPDTDWDHIWKHEKNEVLASGPSTRTRIRLVRRMVRRYARDGQSLLDVGCGVGALVEAVSRDRWWDRLAGADVAAGPLARARLLHPDRTWYLLDIQKEKPDAQFDIIVSLATLDILADDRTALANMSATLRPGGYLIVSVQANPAYWSALDDLRAYRRYTAEDLAARCEAAGLRPVRSFTWGWPLYALYYKILERHDDAMRRDERKGFFARIASRLLYVIFFFDDLCIVAGRGRQLFAVFQKI